MIKKRRLRFGETEQSQPKPIVIQKTKKNGHQYKYYQNNQQQTKPVAKSSNQPKQKWREQWWQKLKKPLADTNLFALKKHESILKRDEHEKYTSLRFYIYISKSSPHLLPYYNMCPLPIGWTNTIANSAIR